jgi:hypothetical protein
MRRLAFHHRFGDTLSGLASFALLFTVVSGAACGTEAQAVDECRNIEQARCEAGAQCGLVDDVEECKRFYRDHCLHGMVVDSPGQSQVDRCVSTIQAAGNCAAGDPDAPLSDCSAVTTGTSATLACDVVLYPERTTECDFLASEPVGTGGTGSPPPSDAGAGGSAG